MPITAPPPKHTSGVGYVPSPDAAALLSLLMPGLGQLWSGDRRKGLLFLAAHLINLSALFIVVCAPSILDALNQFALTYHIHLNVELSHSFSDLGPGSASSIIISMLALSFAAFAARDAYDSAARIKRQAIYHDHVIAMPEATSGSYIFHVSFLLACIILAFFFLIPPPPRSQVTDIEFLQNEENTKEKITSSKRAEHSSKAAGHHDPRKATQLSGAAASASKSIERPKSETSPKQKTQKSETQKEHTEESAPSAKAAAPQAPAPSQNFTPRPQPTLRPQNVPMPQAPAPTPTAQAPRASAPTPTIANASISPETPRTPILPAPVAVGFSKFAPVPVAVSKIAMGTPGPALPPNLVRPTSTAGSMPGPIAVNTAGRISTDGGTGTNPLPVPVSGRGNANNKNSAADGNGNAPSPRAASRALTDSGVGSGLPRPQVGDGPGSHGSKGTSPETNPDEGKGKGQNADVEVAPDFGPYMADLQRRIKRCWFPPKDQETKRVKVVFTISNDGELSNLRVVTTSGSQMADNAALKAVQQAAPFRHLPPHSPKSVDIEFTFDYNVFGSSGNVRHF